MKSSITRLLSIAGVVLACLPSNAQSNLSLTTVSGVVLFGAQSARSGQVSLEEDLKPTTGLGVEVRQEWAREGLGYSLAVGYLQRDIDVVRSYWAGGLVEDRTQQTDSRGYLSGGMHFHLLDSAPVDLEVGPLFGGTWGSDSDGAILYGLEVMGRQATVAGRWGVSLGVRYLNISIPSDIETKRGWTAALVVGVTRVR